MSSLIPVPDFLRLFQVCALGATSSLVFVISKLASSLGNHEDSPCFPFLSLPSSSSDPLLSKIIAPTFLISPVYCRAQNPTTAPDNPHNLVLSLIGLKLSSNSQAMKSRVPLTLRVLYTMLYAWRKLQDVEGEVGTLRASRNPLLTPK